MEVIAPQAGRVRAGLHLRNGLVDRADVAMIDGVRCTSLPRMALDLARARPLFEALVVLDAAVARKGRPALVDACARMPGGAGVPHLHDAVALADPRSESPLESASRGVILGAGLPVPELQAWVLDDEDRAWRVDVLWRQQGLIGEADGWGKYAGPADLRAEKRREDALRRAGWSFVRWTADEVWRDPDALERTLRGALA